MSAPATGSTMAEVSAKWRRFVLLGVVLIALGVIAWLDVIRVAIASTIIIGAILLIAGIFQIVHAFATQQWRSFVLGVLCGVLYLIGGILVMNEPPEGAVVLTLLLAATIVGSGLIRIAL